MPQLLLWRQVLNHNPGLTLGTSPQKSGIVFLQTCNPPTHLVCLLFLGNKTEPQGCMYYWQAGTHMHRSTRTHPHACMRIRICAYTHAAGYPCLSCTAQTKVASCQCQLVLTVGVHHLPLNNVFCVIPHCACAPNQWRTHTYVTGCRQTFFTFMGPLWGRVRDFSGFSSFTFNFTTCTLHSPILTLVTCTQFSCTV